MKSMPYQDRMSNDLIWLHVRALAQHVPRILPNLAYYISCMSLVYTYPLGYHENIQLVTQLALCSV
jgi:hypothetical protein